MELPEELYEWLHGMSLYGLKPYNEAKGTIPETIASSFEQGYGLKSLVNYMYSTLNKQLSPTTEIDKLRPPKNVSHKLHNWKIIRSVLKGIGVTLNTEALSLIAVGERKILVNILEKIYNARGTPIVYKATALQLDGIDSAKKLSESKNCFEFLIISLCRNFGLTSKQGAALLTSNNIYLAQITAKGFRGDFSPVLQWYRDIYGNAELLTNYMKAEEQENSLKCVLNAIKHGLTAEDSEVVQWCINVFSRIVLEAGDIELLGPMWGWFTKGNNSALALIIALAQKKDNEMTAALVELLLLFGEKYYSELFTVLIPSLCDGSGKYFTVIAEFLPYLTENSGIVNEIEASGVIAY